MKNIVIKALIALMVISGVPGFSAAEVMLSRAEQAQIGKAKSFNTLKRHKEAAAILAPLHEKYAQNKEIAVDLAIAWGYGQEPDKAVRLMDQLIQNDPQDQDLERLYASILEANERFGDALDRQIKRLEQSPGDSAAVQKAAQLAKWDKQYDKAAVYLEQMLEQFPGDRNYQIELADIFYLSADYMRAIEYYTKASVDIKDAEAFEKLTYSYLNQGKKDLASEGLRQLSALDPGNMKIKSDLANILYSSGELEEAEAKFSEIITANPEDEKILINLMEILATRRQYDKALAMCDRVLDGDSANLDAKLWKARILSWQPNYEASLTLYDQLIAQKPDWILVRREKARVLGWTREYRKSIKEYDKIASQVKEDEIVLMERAAKNALYRDRPIGAVKHFNRWLTLEPDHLEALFDLAQTESRLMHWDRAQELYGRTLAIMPEHWRAKQANVKAAIAKKEILVRQTFEFYEADSGSRFSDLRYASSDTSLRIALRKGFYLNINDRIYYYDFPETFSSVHQHRNGLEFEYYYKPRLWMRTGFNYNAYSDGLGDGNNFFEKIFIRPFDPLIVELSHQHEDVIENVHTLTHHLRKDDYRVRADWEINRRFQAGGDYMFSDYTDGNERDAFGVDLKSIITYAPRRLTVQYRYESYRFERTRDYYFTPGSFHAHGIGWEWRHYLNKDELYWGANDIYYTLRYTTNLDVDSLTGHAFYADWHKDVNDRLSVHMEASKKIYDHAGIYSEDRITANVKYSF